MSDTTDDAVEPRVRRRGAGLFSLIALLIGADILADADAGESWRHMSLELGILVLALIGAAILFRNLLTAERKAEGLGRDLERTRVEVERWQAQARDLLKGLGEAIDEQFARWELSAAERQVGLMLLKGLSLRDIAGLRKTSERTVRQQAFAIYQKAGLAGRAELSAFFLEEMLLPMSPKATGQRGG